MTVFLLTFNRRTRDVDVAEIDDTSTAMARLFEAEHRAKDMPDLEVVMLTAEEEDDLRKTHSHYFESVEELLAQ